MTDAIGDPDALMAIWTRQNFRTVTFCLNKSLPDEFNAPRRKSRVLSDYIAFRSSLTAAADTTALQALYTPYSLLLAQFGIEYEATKAVIVAQLTELGFATPETEATNLLATNIANQETALIQTASFDPC